MQASQSLQNAIYADPSRAITAQPTFLADHPAYDTVEGPVYGWNDPVYGWIWTIKQSLGDASCPSSTMPSRYQPHTLQPVPEPALGLDSQTDAAISPTYPVVCGHFMQLIAQDSAAKFLPVLNWGQTISATRDQLPAPSLESFYLAGRKALPAWFTLCPFTVEHLSIMPCNQSNSGAFRYWTEEAHKDPRAMNLAKQLDLLIPPGIQYEYQWDPFYPMRRLVVTGNDSVENLALFFGPTWHQDTPYYHWICRMSLFFPPEIGSLHWQEQSHIDETMSESRWTPNMPFACECGAIAEMIGYDGLEHILHRLRWAYRLTRYYEAWPYVVSQLGVDIVQRHYLGTKPDHLGSAGKPVSCEDAVPQEHGADARGAEAKAEVLESPRSVDSSEHHTSDRAFTETRSTSLGPSPVPEEGKIL